MPAGYTILLIGAWVLGSGLVAYVCDNLGRKLGKKRLTLWGMRPRHTAMVMTVLTGIGIAAITVGMVALVNGDARRALTQMGTIDQQIRDLSHRQAALVRRNKELTALAQKLEEDAEKNEARATESEGHAAAAASKLLTVQDQRNRVEKDMGAMKERLRDLNDSRNRLTRQVHLRQRQLASLTIRLQKSQIQLRQANYRVRLSEGRLKDTKNQLARSQGNLSQAKEEVRQARNEQKAAQEEVKTLQAHVISETRKLDSLTQELNKTQIALNEGQERLKELNRTLNVAADESDTLMLSTIAFRQIPATFTLGQEVARRVIYNPDNPSEINYQIVKLLDTAAETARSLGAEGRPGERCVKLAPYRYVQPDGKEAELGESEQILRFSDLIVKDKNDVVVILRSEGNAVKGEPVQVSMEVAENRLVFPRDTVVHKQAIDGSRPDSEVLKTLIKILQTDVRNEALSAGLLPPPSGALGEIDWDSMLDAMKKIRLKNGPSDVRVITQADTWTADPLLVRFIVAS